MNRIIKGSFAVLAVLALGSVAAPAAARSTPASIGRANLASKAVCFDASLGTIKNSHCTPVPGDSGTHWFTIPLVSDGFLPNYTPVVYGYLPSGNYGALQCGAHAVFSDGITLLSGSGMTTMSTFGVHGVGFTLNTITVLPNASAYVECLVPPQGQIISVHY